MLAPTKIPTVQQSFQKHSMHHLGMDWLCPGYSSVLAKQLDNYHGQLTPDVTIHDILPVVQSGDLHIAVYDLQNELMYVSNARADKETGPDMAYDRYITSTTYTTFLLPSIAI